MEHADFMSLMVHYKRVQKPPIGIWKNSCLHCLIYSMRAHLDELITKVWLRRRSQVRYKFLKDFSFVWKHECSSLLEKIIFCLHYLPQTCPTISPKFVLNLFFIYILYIGYHKYLFQESPKHWFVDLTSWEHYVLPRYILSHFFRLPYDFLCYLMGREWICGKKGSNNLA